MMARKKKEGLSVKQAKVLLEMVEFFLREGRAPTFREVMEVADISSTSVVAYYMDKFEELGYVTRIDNKYQYTINEMVVQPPHWYYGIKAKYEDMRIHTLDIDWSKPLEA
ncbi:MAG: LexA family protein [Planctomycetota bacterium]|jgi:SOS-response transcriptional repressor LexA